MANLERTIEIGTVVGIAILGVESFPKYLPAVSDIRAAGPGDKKVAADVHAGELLAGITIGTVSLMASSVAQSGLPLAIGCTAFVTMFITYEWLLRSKPFEK